MSFFFQFIEDAIDVVPVEPDACGFASELKTLKEGRKAARNAMKDGFVSVFFWSSDALFTALFCFDDFPVAKDFCGIPGLFFAEDVRVAANHFLVNFADDIGDVEAILFAGNLGVEQDLKEKVAEFFGKFGVVVSVQGLENFVGFFDEVRAQGGVGLFAVPWTSAGGAEVGHDAD